MNSAYVTLIGSVVLAAAVIFTQWRNGGNVATREALDSYRTRVAQLKEDLETLRSESHTKQNEMAGKIGTLEGQLKEKENTIQTLSAIFQDRNPESQLFMENLTKVGEAAMHYINTNGPLIQEIHAAMIKNKRHTRVKSDTIVADV